MGLSYPDTPCTYIAGMNLSNQGVLAGQLQDGSFLCYFPSSITVWQNFALHKELQHKKYLILAWSLEQDEDYVSRAQLFAYASSIMERRKTKQKERYNFPLLVNTSNESNLTKEDAFCYNRKTSRKKRCLSCFLMKSKR